MTEPDAGAGGDTDAGTGQGSSSPPSFDRRMLEALVCPLTQAGLSYDAERQELVSRSARLAFPIRGGIPIMLMSEARELD